MIKRLTTGKEDTGCEISIEDGIVTITCMESAVLIHTESMSLKYFKETLGL